VTLSDLTHDFQPIAIRCRMGDWEGWQYCVGDSDPHRAVQSAREAGMIVTGQRRRTDGTMELVAKRAGG
jgi:hypothetical protein